MDRLEGMRVFLRVAEMESFTQAAESLSLPKATVSNAVQALEAGLGVRLLQRTTRRVQLTQDGVHFFERCKDLLADVEEMESMFQKDGAGITGRLRVDMPQGVARDLILPKLPGFLREHPGLEIELGSSDRRVDLIREGFDCVVRVGNLVDSGLISRPLGKLVLVNCVSPDYLKRHGKPRRIEDLASHQLVHYAQNFGAKPEGFEYPDGDGYRCLPMKGAVTVNNTDSYRAACLAGLGIIQVPLIGVREHLKKGTLVEILPKLRAEPMPVSFLYPHRRHLAKRVRVFMDWAAELMKEYTRE